MPSLSAEAAYAERTVPTERVADALSAPEGEVVCVAAELTAEVRSVAGSSG